MPVSFDSSVNKFEDAKKQVVAAENALKMHDSQTRALIEDITLRAAILRKIDPALINEARLKTGIRVIDAVINLFYVLNTRVYKKRIQQHLTPYRLAVSQLSEDEQKRIELIQKLYHKTLIKELNKPVFLSSTDNSISHHTTIIKKANAKFGTESFRDKSHRLSREQINPNFKLC